MPDGGATASAAGAESSTTRGTTTASVTRTAATGFGLTTTLLTNFPVFRSGCTTLVTRCGLSEPAPNNAPAAKPAINILKQNWRKMFSLILSLKPHVFAAAPAIPGGFTEP